ncbi:thioredoxin family protein [Flavobacterium cellulosilyticum]|nr:thioredoxin family protein [Flavobacterium cellulosilyticum]
MCFCFFFIFVQTGIAQTSFKFDERNYQTILSTSKTENKPIFMMLYATWCPHCNKMKNTVFKEEKVRSMLRTNFICTWFDIDTPEGKILNTKFNLTSLPTFVFLDSNETELYRLKGELSTSDFIQELNNALNSKLQLPFLEKEYINMPSDSQKWLNYMNVLKKGKDREYLAEKVKAYFDSQTDEQLISPTNWVIIANCVTDISSREFQFVLKHQIEFEAISSPLRVERKIISIVTESLKPLTESFDTIAYYQKRKIAKTIQLQKTDSLIYRYDLTIAERTGNWSAYKKIAIESTEKFAWKDPTLLKEISQNFLKYITDVPSLNLAIKWTTHSLLLNDSYDGNLLLSNLYLKTNNKNSAITAARKSKVICTAYSFNPKEVDELYIKLGITK